MVDVWVYALGSVFIVSLISFIGVFTLSINPKKLKKILIYLISFSAGALLGGAFLHLLPEIVSVKGFTLSISFLILGGIALFFFLEKIIHWRHCHMPTTEDHVHPFAIMNLVGDSFHNFLDGLIIGASYLVSIPVGVATTIAVVFHEIPQEIGDLGVLIHGGFSRGKALMVNFFTALTALLGVGVALIGARYVESIELILVPLAIGGFIYIAGSDLIPELHKDVGIGKAFLQLLAFAIGILVMAALLFI